MKIVIAGGGWSGCAAALQAAKLGAEVTLLERTDMLLGTGLVGGIMRNNGRFTATEELIALGGGDIFEAVDGNYLHESIEFPGHQHASLYNVATMEPLIRRLLNTWKVDIRTETRVTDVVMDGDRISALTGKQKIDGMECRLPGDVFIDTTGTAGPPAMCNKYGHGCAMCILRCHSYGGRVSVTAKAGVKEIIAEKNGQVGAMSGSCKLHKESLSQDIHMELNRKGVVIIPLTPEQRTTGKLAMKACQQYALPDYEQNLILLDTGHAKLMTPFMPLDHLRSVPGFENARFEDPYSGGLGNSIRYMGMAPRDDALQVLGVSNLFCAGEKAGLLVGHTEAICTGVLAGYNAVKLAKGGTPIVLPEESVIGDAVRFVREEMRRKEGLGKKYTFSGSIYLDRMIAQNTYSTDVRKIRDRVAKAGLTDIFTSA